MKRCIDCKKRIWFFQKRAKLPNPLTGETTVILLPLHYNCMMAKLKAICIEVIKEHDRRKEAVSDGQRQ